MTRRRYWVVLRAGLAALAALTLLAVDPAPASAHGASGRTIEGVWRTGVGPRDCQTDAVGPLVIRGLFTIQEGGTMSEYGIGPGSSPALRSPGHGTWKRTRGWQEYSIAFLYYRYDASGAFAGMQRVQATLQLAANGQEFTGKSVVGQYDVNDNLVATFCVASVGTRFR